jgi:MarR family transcriptional regulator for hemolysin
MDLNKEGVIKEPVGRVMGRISRLLLARLQHELRHLDIDRSFYPLLLIEAGKGELTQKDLARQLSIDKVQVVRIIDYLSMNGYVERVQDVNDRRKYKLVVTEKAAQFLPDIKNAMKETNSMALRNIADPKTEELNELLKIIDNNLSTQIKT